MATFIRSSAFSTVAGIISLAFGFAGSVIVARLLGPQGSGEVAFALFIAMTASTLVGLGIPNLLLRYIPTYDRPGHPGGGLARVLLPYFLVPTVLVAAGLVAYALWLQVTHHVTEHAPSTWAMTSLILLSYAIASLSESAARGLNRFAETTRLTFIGCLIQLPLIAVGGYLFGVAGALAGHVGRHLPQAVGLWRYIAQKPDPGIVVTPKMKALGRDSWFSAAVGMFIWTRMEFFFLGLYFGTTEIGHYAAGLTLAGLVVQLPTQMLGGLTPHIGRHHDSGDLDRIRLTYHRIMRWLSLLILPICFGGAAIMGELLPLLFGPDFRESVPMAQVLVGFAFITALSTVPTIIIGACERSGFFVYASPITAVVSLLSFALIIPEGAGLGSAWARTGVHGLWLTWLIAFCWMRLRIGLNVKDLLLIALAALVCAAVAYGVLLEIQGLVGLVLSVACGALVYAIALRVLRVVPHNDVVALATNLPSKLPRRLSDLIYRLLLLVVPTRRSDD